MLEALINPVVTFLIALLVVAIIYAIAGRLGPPFKEAMHKLENYACGEDYSGQRALPSYGLFHVAFFFTVMHVGVLLLATAPEGNAALLGIVLIGAMALTGIALFVGGGQRA
ncbi:MAG: hypothetical protein AB1665_03940 [Candidatus Thermoplasmatota archaeon]